MKIKAYKTEDEIPEGAEYMCSRDESWMAVHYFLVNEKVETPKLINNTCRHEILLGQDCKMCKIELEQLI